MQQQLFPPNDEQLSFSPPAGMTNTHIQAVCCVLFEDGADTRFAWLIYKIMLLKVVQSFLSDSHRVVVMQFSS